MKHGEFEYDQKVSDAGKAVRGKCASGTQLALLAAEAKIDEQAKEIERLSTAAVYRAFGSFLQELRGLLQDHGVASNPGWTEKDVFDAIRAQIAALTELIRVKDEFLRGLSGVPFHYEGTTQVVVNDKRLAAVISATPETVRARVEAVGKVIGAVKWKYADEAIRGCTCNICVPLRSLDEVEKG
jgi:hypothetical protein